MIIYFFMYSGKMFTFCNKILKLMWNKQFKTTPQSLQNKKSFYKCCCMLKVYEQYKREKCLAFCRVCRWICSLQWWHLDLKMVQEHLSVCRICILKNFSNITAIINGDKLAYKLLCQMNVIELTVSVDDKSEIYLQEEVHPEKCWVSALWYVVDLNQSTKKKTRMEFKYRK